MKIKQSISAALATGALMLAFASPAMAANTISGTGAFSWNKISKWSSKNVNLGQNNTAVFGTSVNANANSGNNSSSFNVAGTSGVSTNPATNNTTVNNTAGLNTATVAGCGCLQAGSGDNTISNTGAFSVNKINLASSENLNVSQNNTTVISNSVNTNANSGNNSSSFNVGGSSGVSSGAATNNTTVNNTAGANNLVVTP